MAFKYEANFASENNEWILILNLKFRILDPGIDKDLTL